MQTAPHSEEVMKAPGSRFVRHFMVRDQGVRFRAESRRILKPHIVLQLRNFSFPLIPLLACNLASPATDASRDIDQRRLDRCLGRWRRHSFLAFGVRAVLTDSRALTTFTKQAFVSCVPAPGSTASIVM